MGHLHLAGWLLSDTEFETPTDSKPSQHFFFIYTPTIPEDGMTDRLAPEQAGDRGGALSCPGVLQQDFPGTQEVS